MEKHENKIQVDGVKQTRFENSERKSKGIVEASFMYIHAHTPLQTRTTGTEVISNAPVRNILPNCFNRLLKSKNSYPLIHE